MADDFKVQASMKTGEHLFNFRGQTVDEVTEQLEAFAANADRIFEVYSTVKQVTMAKGLNGFTPAAPVTSNVQNAAPAAGATATNLRCKHGAFKDFKGKTKKDGTGYQYRYYCAAPYVAGGNPDQCKPASLPGQEGWS